MKFALMKFAYGENYLYYTTEVGESSVWQISKKYFAGVIYGQKSFMC